MWAAGGASAATVEEVVGSGSGAARCVGLVAGVAGVAARWRGVLAIRREVRKMKARAAAALSSSLKSVPGMHPPPPPPRVASSSLSLSVSRGATCAPPPAGFLMWWKAPVRDGNLDRRNVWGAHLWVFRRIVISTCVPTGPCSSALLDEGLRPFGSGVLEIHIHIHTQRYTYTYTHTHTHTHTTHTHTHTHLKQRSARRGFEAFRIRCI